MFKVTTYFVLRIFLRVLFFKIKLGLFAPNNFHLKWQDTNTNANKYMNLKLMNLRLTNKILYWLLFSTDTKNKLWLEEISKVYKSKTCDPVYTYPARAIWLRLFLRITHSQIKFYLFIFRLRVSEIFSLILNYSRTNRSIKNSHVLIYLWVGLFLATFCYHSIK